MIASSYTGSAQAEPGGTTKAIRAVSSRTRSTAATSAGPPNVIAPGTAGSGFAPMASSSASYSNPWPASSMTRRASGCTSASVPTCTSNGALRWMTSYGSALGIPNPNGAATASGRGGNSRVGVSTVMRGRSPARERSAATASMAATPPPAMTICGGVWSWRRPYGRPRPPPSVARPEPEEGQSRFRFAARCQRAGVAYVDLHWLPLGAGGPKIVRRPVASTGADRRRPTTRRSRPRWMGLWTIEVAPSPDENQASRGVVATGAVGARLAGRLRVFRYEVRCCAADDPDLATRSRDRLTETHTSARAGARPTSHPGLGTALELELHGRLVSAACRGIAPRPAARRAGLRETTGLRGGPGQPAYSPPVPSPS